VGAGYRSTSQRRIPYHFYQAFVIFIYPRRTVSMYSDEPWAGGGRGSRNETRSWLF